MLDIPKPTCLSKGDESKCTRHGWLHLLLAVHVRLCFVRLQRDTKRKGRLFGGSNSIYILDSPCFPTLTPHVRALGGNSVRPEAARGEQPISLHHQRGAEAVGGLGSGP